MKNRPRVERQHEPVRVPQGWADQSRAMIIQLNRILDDVYIKLYDAEAKLADAEAKLADAEERIGEIQTASEEIAEREKRVENMPFPTGISNNENDHQIPAYADYNDYLSVGTYGSGANVNVVTCANRPCDVAGKLCVWEVYGDDIVGNWKYGGQIYLTIDNREYRRIISTNGDGELSYSPWENVSPLTTEQHSSAQFTVASGGQSYIDIDMTKAGHKLIGIVQITNSGGAELSFSDWFLPNSTTARIYYRNNSSATKTVTMKVTGLYIRG